MRIDFNQREFKSVSFRSVGIGIPPWLILIPHVVVAAPPRWVLREIRGWNSSPKFARRAQILEVGNTDSTEFEESSFGLLPLCNR